MFDFTAYPYPSKRYLKYSSRGMCATSNHLSAEAGLDMLKKGGNAIDAAIAAAACLTVLEPQSNGIGSDAFAILWTGGKMYGLNSSGHSPENMDADALRAKGLREMPTLGLTPVTVPGAPAAWASLSQRFGSLPLETVLEPAIRYASEGFAATYFYSQGVKNFAGVLKKEGGEQFTPWFDTFMPGGKAPEPGEPVTNPDAAKTLELIAKSQAEEFYRGSIAEKLDRFSRQYDGLIRKEDMAAFHADWVEPICMNYRGYDVWEIPPNGQGIIALMALNILKGFDPLKKDDVLSVHRQIEAVKLAFADAKKYVADPRYMGVKVQDLLSPAYGDERRREIKDTAQDPFPGRPMGSGTVYLCAADTKGNMISFIQSNYKGYGSGIVVPGTGVSLQNRGLGFMLEKGHVNEAGPRKKPYHTIIPGFLTKDGQPIGPFGLMGGNMQPQGHTQVMQNFIDCGLNPQACIDAPRWCWEQGKTVAFETAYPDYLVEGLKARGHDIRIELSPSIFGKSQMIFNTGYGTLMGGTEPRCEGECAAW